MADDVVRHGARLEVEGARGREARPRGRTDETAVEHEEVQRVRVGEDAPRRQPDHVAADGQAQLARAAVRVAPGERLDGLRAEALERVEVLAHHAVGGQHAAIRQMVERRHAVVARKRAGMLRDDAAARQLVDTLERREVLAHRRRSAVHLVERRARYAKHLGRPVRGDGGAAPLAPHERQLAHAAAALDVPDETAPAAVLAPDRQPAHRHEVERVGVVALAEQDLAVGEHSPVRRDVVEPETARERRENLQIASDLVGAERPHPLTKRVVDRERGLEVGLGHPRQPRRLRRARPRATPPRGARQQRLLAEVLAGVQPHQHDLAAVAVPREDLHGAGEDDVHRVTRVALVEHHRAGRDRDLLRAGGERTEAPRVEAAEEPAASEGVREVDHGAA